MIKVNRANYNRKSEDRVRIIILSSLFVLSGLLSGCGGNQEVEIIGEEYFYNSDDYDGNNGYGTANADHEGTSIDWDVNSGKVISGNATSKNVTRLNVNSENINSGVVDNGGKIVVHICGAVNCPGVYELNEGDRVIDGINAAKGVTDEAESSAVNMARVLNDGEKVYIPTEKEALDEDFVSSNVEIPVIGSSKININTASETELTEITGVGATRAKAIISYREEKGGFRRVEDIKNITGIGDKTYEKIKDKITVD